jgi:hypothetical protein
MLHVHTKRRSGAYASSRQDTDYAGAGVVRSYDPRSTTRGTACLAWMCVQAVLKPRSTPLGPVPERLFFGYEGV